MRLTFSSKLDWGSYIIPIAETATKKIGVLIHSMKFLSAETALYLYKSTIHPCMEYQWCNLILVWWFWATKVCLRASKISKMSVWSPNWTSNILKDRFWKLFLILFDKMVSILINTIQHEQYFFLFYTILCSSLMSYHQANNKCNNSNNNSKRKVL